MKENYSINLLKLMQQWFQSKLNRYSIVIREAQQERKKSNRKSDSCGISIARFHNNSHNWIQQIFHTFQFLHLNLKSLKITILQSIAVFFFIFHLQTRIRSVDFNVIRTFVMDIVVWKYSCRFKWVETFEHLICLNTSFGLKVFYKLFSFITLIVNWKI